MSAFINSTAKCLNCGSIFSVQQYTSVNVTADPHLKERLVNRSLITFTCPICGRKSDVPHDILYHDMARRVMVMYVSKDASGVSSVATPALDLAQAALSHYRLRLVTEWEHLLEKIAVFDADLV
jgi:hypothetical protein